MLPDSVRMTVVATALRVLPQPSRPSCLKLRSGVSFVHRSLLGRSDWHVLRRRLG